MNNQYNFSHSDKSQSSHVGSFLSVLGEVRAQVEADYISPALHSGADELCLIIAEVYRLPRDTEIKIDGMKLSAGDVQEIYSLLTCEHIKLVLENFSRICYEVRFKKTYLRTALYNSVFELEAHWKNQVNTDNPEWVKAPFGVKV